MAVSVNEKVKLPVELSTKEKMVTWVFDNVPSFILLIAGWEVIAWFVAEPALFPRVGPIVYRADSRRPERGWRLCRRGRGRKSGGQVQEDCRRFEESGLAEEIRLGTIGGGRWF